MAISFLPLVVGPFPGLFHDLRRGAADRPAFQRLSRNQPNFFGWLLLTTFSDITILFADFLVGVALYQTLMAEP